jgi:hypothetical protein
MRRESHDFQHKLKTPNDSRSQVRYRGSVLALCRRAMCSNLDRLFTAPAVLLSLAATSLRDAPASSSWRRRASSSAVHGRFRVRMRGPRSSGYLVAAAGAHEPHLAARAIGPFRKDCCHRPSRTPWACHEHGIGFDHAVTPISLNPATTRTKGTGGSSGCQPGRAARRNAQNFETSDEAIRLRERSF